MWIPLDVLGKEFQVEQNTLVKYACAYVIALPMILRHIDAVPHSVCNSKVRSFGNWLINSGICVSENRVEEPMFATPK